MGLSQSEVKRYNRQIRIAHWGSEGQKKLKSSKVAVVGIGGLGCVSSLYLVAAGIGNLVIIDKEKPNLMDLNRQILFSVSDVKQTKADIAKKKMRTLNPETNIEPVNREVTKENIQQILRGVMLVIDGLDNWKTRFIVNEYCVKSGTPFIHAGISEFYGQITSIMPGKGPCLRCLFPRIPDDIEVIATLGATSAAIASLQVIEAIKLLIGIGEPLVGRMLFLDGEEMTVEIADIKRNLKCPVCAFY